VGHRSGWLVSGRAVRSVVRVVGHCLSRRVRGQVGGIEVGLAGGFGVGLAGASEVGLACPVFTVLIPHVLFE